jgi:hypothetical protein
MAQWLVDNGADVNFHGPGFSLTNGRVTRYSYPVTVAAKFRVPVPYGAPAEETRARGLPARATE